MESSKYKRRKFDIVEINELLENNIEAAADIYFDIHECINEKTLKWLENYNNVTSGQPLPLYYTLMATIGHVSMESTIIQLDHVHHLNLYAIIIGNSGMISFLLTFITKV